MLRIIIFSILGFYLFFGLLLFFFQERLVYMPTRDTNTTPKSWGLSWEEVTFTTSDGLKIWGWFVSAPKARGTLLFCHGNAGNLTHRGDSIQTFISLGLNVFIFDYRGYGKSEGSPTEKGTYLDGEGAFQYLTETRKISPSEIVIFGRSLGGGIASYLAEKYPPKILILESTFTSAVDVGAELYSFFPVRLLARIQYPTKKRIPKMNCPILFIHSPQDEVIPYTHSRKLFELAKEPKEFIEIKGGHNEGFWLSGKIYQEGMEKFLKKYLK